MTAHVELIEGDCREVMRELDENSIDAIVTDPPYGLEFMGKGWDTFTGAGMSKPGIGQRDIEWPSFAGSNTLRCETCGLLIGHGGSPCRCKEPKPYSVIPSRMRAFQEWSYDWAVEALRVLKPGGHLLAFGGTRTYHRLASAIEDAGFEIRDQIGWLYGSGFPKSSNQHGDWKGWGTALKPAWEPIAVARKPLVGTVGANLERWGVGALNIDGARVPFADAADEAESKTKNQHADFGSGPMTNQVFGKFTKDRENYDPEGRWPANVIHDGDDEVVEAFAAFGSAPMRFFYCAKASKAERGVGNTHPTVKPQALMRYLCRLVTPPGGTILDPFCGSGTTALAARAEGFNCVIIEQDPTYYDIAERRLWPEDVKEAAE